MSGRYFTMRVLIAVGLVLAALCLTGGAVLAGPPAQREAKKGVVSAAIRSYVYGYPLVMMGLTEAVTTNVHDAIHTYGRAPKNQFANGNALPDETYTDVVLPNVDTLYSLAWLDLTKEPIVLHIPNLKGRFFLFETVDAWTEVLPDSPGARSLTTAGNYAFVGPDWSGTLPQGITKAYYMATNTIWIIGRTYTDGSQKDINKIVNKIQPKYTLTPLTYFQQPYTPPSNSPIDPTVDMTTPVYQQVANMDACAFFGTLASLMTTNPPVAEDARAVKRLAKLGVVPTKNFDCSKIDPQTLAEMQEAVVLARELIEKVAHTPPQQLVNGWQMPLDLGAFGRRYLLRASVARNGIGANYFLDAVYAGSTRDRTGQALNSANNYTLHFNKGEFPPANENAFWSVTMYHTVTETLVANPLHRYALGIPDVQEHEPCKNDDGSITLYIQATQPVPTPQDPNNLCNWLPSPSPAGDFVLVIRIYWPDQSVFDGDWLPPAISNQN